MRAVDQSVRRPERRVLPLILLLLAALPLTSCKTPALLCFKSSGLGRFAIVSTPGINKDRAIAIDLVFITDKKILESISAMKARDYFAMHDQIERDYTKGYIFRHWEIQPGQYIDPEKTKAPCNIVGTLLFANYRYIGPFREKIDKSKSGTLVLGEKNFKWVPEKS